jgi:hypothetical protein
MSDSTLKKLALALFIVLIVIAFFRLTPWILAPFGVFPVNIAQFMKNAATFPGHSWHLPGFLFILSLLFLALWIAVIVWVYRDAEKRGMNGFLWALLVFIGNLLALIIYLIVRFEGKPENGIPAAGCSCPSCGRPVSSGYSYCPFCGAVLESRCPACKQPVEPSWKVCPLCGESLRGSGKMNKKAE